ncbi:hypothetical protein [Aerophototrophica crusticola]
MIEGRPRDGAVQHGRTVAWVAGQAFPSPLLLELLAARADRRP